MLSFTITLIQILSCIGFGLVTLSLLGLLDDFADLTLIAVAFSIGLGILGWLVFIAGVANAIYQPYLVVLLLLGLLGLFYLRGRVSYPKLQKVGWQGVLLLILIVVAFCFDFLEALSPPGDGDTLAYHFVIPRNFINAGQMIFEPRAIDGAVPLLVQMTYIPVLAIGGELSLTFWVLMSGWGAGVLLFALLRQHLDFIWSLSTTLTFMTVSAVVIGAGSGMVEIRISLFVMISAYAAARALYTNRINYVILAGLGVGFFVGAKYLGLLFAIGVGIVLLLRAGWFRRGLIYSVVVIVAGCQWYVWNWIHTGDPFFPVLFALIGDLETPFWDLTHQSILRNYFSSELGVPVNLFWFIAYPIRATIQGFPAFDSLRAGLGPLPLLLTPFAVTGLWIYRQKIKGSNLFIYALIAFLFYIIWFFSGSSQRIRHLLPILPLILICLAVPAQRLTAKYNVDRPLFAAIILTIFLQLSSHGLFTLKSARYVFSNETRDNYLERTISWYQPVQWINENLTKKDHVLSMVRWYEYLLNVPHYWAHQYTQSLVNLIPETNNVGLFVQQIQKLEISHILQWPSPSEQENGTEKSSDVLLNQYIDKLQMANCLIPVKTFKVRRFASRTLPSHTTYSATTTLFKFTSTNCKI